MNTIDASLRALEIQGTTVPKLGFGTWQIEGPECQEAVEDALAIGYRHIDTARAYGNEREVGQGIAAAGVPRNEFFLTTKIRREEYAPDDLRRAAEDSLQNLQVDCLDLLLLHWPNPDFALQETLGALIGLRDDGLIKHLGVSNFPVTLLREALEFAPIFTDQVEFHPFLSQDALVELAAEKDFMVTAYSPLARGKVPKDETLREDRRGARQDRRPGRAALAARQAAGRHDPEGLEPRAPGRELRGLRLRAQRRGAGRDRRAGAGRAHHRPGLGARLGRLVREEASQLREHETRVLEDVAVGVAAELVAPSARLAFAAAVLLPRVAGAVVAVAVELDGEPVCGPAAVDATSAGGAVGLREREPAALSRARKRRSRVLRVTWTSPCETLRSVVAPGVVGRRSRTVWTCAGVVPWRTPASWQARARASGVSDAARSTRVRGTVVTGIVCASVTSRGSSVLLRWVRMPSMRRSVRVITSGGGAWRLLMRPWRWAAARPLRTAPGPQALTAAR